MSDHSRRATASSARFKRTKPQPTEQPTTAGDYARARLRKDLLVLAEKANESRVENKQQ